MLLRPVTISTGSIAAVVLLFFGTVYYFDHRINTVLKEQYGSQRDVATNGDKTNDTLAPSTIFPAVNPIATSIPDEGIAVVEEVKLSFNDQISNSTLGVGGLDPR